MKTAIKCVKLEYMLLILFIGQEGNNILFGYKFPKNSKDLRAKCVVDTNLTAYV